MAKAIDHDLLWKSIFWTLYNYSLLSHEQRQERPIRGYFNGDGRYIVEVIHAIRKDYSIKIAKWKEGIGPKPDFEKIKDVVIESLRDEKRWDKETRNLFSSVASTYISWDYNGISERNRRKLTVVESYANMFLRPNK